ncbi:tetratricopeptide repeat protein [Sphingobacteriaceae bacterium AH-315-L07]|nr:tetratricopeptide repeat protein [Sphingobacteriaceae bacterium AH-315-L07]
MIISLLFVVALFINDDKGADYYANRGNQCFYKSKYDSCIYYFTKATQLFKDTARWKDYVNYRRRMGYVHYVNGRYPKALTIYSELCLVAKEKMNDHDETSGLLLINSAQVYIETHKYEAALKFLKDVLKLIENSSKDLEKLKSIAFTNLGIVYGDIGSLRKALVTRIRHSK